MMKFVCSSLSKALNCLACCRLGQLVSARQVEMGWPDIHWLAGGQGRAGCGDSWTGSLMGPFVNLKSGIQCFKKLELRGVWPLCYGIS